MIIGDEIVKKNKYEIDMCNGSIMDKLISFSLPLMLSGILQLMFNAVDIVVVGRFSGSEALAAVGSTTALINVFTNLFIGISLGANVLAARFYASGKDEEMSETVHTSILLALISGIIMAFLGVIFARICLELMDTPEDVIDLSALYMRIYFMGMPFFMLYNYGAAILRAVGDTKRPLYFLIIAGVINAGLNMVLVIVFGLGVAGVGIATVFSQLLSAIWVMRFLTGPKAELRLILRGFRPDGRLIRRIVALGTSTFVMSFTDSLVQVVCNSTLRAYGGDLYISVMTVINSVRQIAQTPALALSDGGSPVISYNYGARMAGRVRAAIRFMTQLGFGYTLLIWALISLFPAAFIRIFNQDPELLAAAVPALQIYFFGFFMMAFQFSGQSVFKSLNKAKLAIFFSLLRKAIIVVPLTLLLPHVAGLGVKGVFLAEPVSNFVGGLACYITMRLTVMPELSAMERAKSAR